jgi:radical SAM superfamily enzyme YgiQ (UPF0313 family)
MNFINNNNLKNKKILLAMLPYWDPIIPPNGISHLKSFLQKHDYEIKTVDVVIEEVFQNIYRTYFKLLEECVPESNRGNFYNIGHYLIQNHMMAHYNYDSERDYIDLVKNLVYKTFYVNISDSRAHELNKVWDDFYLNLEAYFMDLLEKEKPAVVGFSAFKCTLPASLFALKLAKKKNPHVKTVIGGGIFVDSHAIGTPNFEILLEYSKNFLDKLIVGQGELLFLEYLKGKLPDSKRVYTKQDIQGRILPFPGVDLPDYSDFNLARYPYLVTTASASCPNQCSFCSARRYYGEHRIKDVKQLTGEMIELHKRYGHQLFFMTDAMLNPVISDLSRESAKTRHSLYFDAYFRVDDASANLENTMQWRRGGLYRARLGTESGSQAVLDMMDKNITPEQTRNAVSTLAHAGIKTTTYWVTGHPGETEADFQKTLDIMEELQNDIYQAEANPFHYHSSTQFGADQWAGKKINLYSKKFQKMLVFETWTANIKPLRQEAYRRLYRFDEHCKNIGLPNPYSLDDYLKADERWKKLHKYAVPSVLELLSQRGEIKENKNIMSRSPAKNMRQPVEDFEF